VTAGEHIVLPSGQSVWYFHEDHSYWRHNPVTGQRGKQLSGVTAVCKPLDYKPDSLMRWAAEKQCEGVAMLYEQSDGEEFLHWLSNAKAIWRELKDHGLTYDQIRDKKGEEGTNAHVLAFQALAMGRPVPDFDALSKRETQLAKAISLFWLEHDPHASQVEQIVYSERLGVAGRLDFRGRLKARCDNPICACQEAEGPGVIDLKTGGFISVAAHAQVGGGYPLLAEESGYGESNWAAILQVFDDGTYEFFKAESSPECFESAVATYRHAGKTNYRAAKARGARQVARQLQQQTEAMVEAVSG
jgi:hypothetical protein